MGDPSDYFEALLQSIRAIHANEPSTMSARLEQPAWWLAAHDYLTPFIQHCIEQERDSVTHGKH